MALSEHAGAVIIPFPIRAPRSHRLTLRDRIAILAWDEAARLAGYDRVVIRERQPQDDPHIGDYLSVYRAGESWAAWGLARQGWTLRVWRCATGADIGDFPSIEAALAAIEAAPTDPGVAARKQNA
jgi:hypothetical protein